MRKVNELNETTAHLKILSERQRTLSFQCTLHCNGFYISRTEAYQKGEKRNKCNPTETEVSRNGLENYEPNLSESQNLHHFREVDFFFFLNIKQRRHHRARKGKVNKNHEAVVV